MMEIVFEFIFRIVGELVLQLILEFLADAGYHTLVRSLKRRPERKPYFAAMGYLMGGGITGALTLLFFPSLMIEVEGVRVANLIVTPLLVGFAMSALGAWRRSKGLERLRIESFVYGALFAFGLALVRFIWAV